MDSGLRARHGSLQGRGNPISAASASAPAIHATTLQFDAASPFNTALLDQHVYIQAYAFAPGVNSSQVVTSNGIDWLIGNQ